jgi:CRP/FNR family cyclic AMP-dependent transcriptional regulator
MKRMNKLISYIDSFYSSARLGSTLSHYLNKEIIYSQGTPADTLFYIREGAVRLTTRSKYLSSPSAVTAILGVGDFFGELCLGGFPYRVSTAVTLTASSIQVIKKESMIRMLRQNNKLSNSFVSYLLSNIRKYQDSVAELLTSSAEQRLARVLLRLAHLNSRDPSVVGLPHVSDQVLAEMIGTTRPRVNKFMNRFRKRRFISDNGQIEVHKSLQQVLRCGRVAAPRNPSILGGGRLRDPRGSTLSGSHVSL